MPRSFVANRDRSYILGHSRIEVRTMTQGHAAGWRRLLAVSCAHAAELANIKPSLMGGCGRLNRKQISVPEVIRGNVAILGRGTEEAIKARLMWYLTFHPAVCNVSA